MDEKIKVVCYFSRLQNPRRRPSTPGRRNRRVRAFDALKNDLVDVGEIDQYSDIQTYREDVEINALLARIGDPSLAPYARQGFYGDVTNAPETLADAICQASDVRAVVDRLAQKSGLTSADVIEAINDDQAFNALLSLISRRSDGADQNGAGADQKEEKTDE